MHFSTIFFDLDGTIYSNNNGMWRAIKDRISQYLTEIMGFSSKEQAQFRDRYWHTYGTTLRGLQLHHQVNTDEFLAYVHDVPLDQYLKPDKELARFLKSLRQEKWIFTNSDEAHALRVIRALGLEDCFSGIIDIRRLDFFCKPLQEAYVTALAVAGNPKPEECVFVDDLARNLAPAREMGFFTVLYKEDPLVDDAEGAHCRIGALPELIHHIDHSPL